MTPFVLSASVCALAIFSLTEGHMQELDRVVRAPEPVGAESAPAGKGYTAKSAPGERREPSRVAAIAFEKVGGAYRLAGRNAEGEQVECPKTIEIGEVGKPAAGAKLNFGPKSGVVSHTDISVDGVKCSSGGFLEIADLGDVGSDPGDGNDKNTLARVAVAEDSEARVCGGRKFRGLFQFYDDMPRYVASLEDIGGVPPGGLSGARSGDIYFPLIQEPEGGDSMDAPAAYCWYKNSMKQTDASERPEESKGKDSGSCFPASASVELEDGTFVLMQDLKVGDVVKVGPRQFSPVFMFTHKLSGIEEEFVVLETESGAALPLTKGHYVYADGSMVPGSAVRVGASVVLGTGASDVVAAVSTVRLTGLFNPQTIHGDIVVNGVLASTYTTAVSPTYAHALLSPLRYMFSRLGFSSDAFDRGAEPVVALLPSGKYVV